MRFNIATFLLILMAAAGLLTACSSISDVTDAAGINSTIEAAGVIETRPAPPTATPDAITEAVENIVAPTFIDDVTFLGLDGTDWINLVISLVMVFLGYLLGSWVARFLVRLVSRYFVDEDALALLARTGRLLKWLIVLVIAHLAIIRLQFLSPFSKQLLSSLIFITGLVIAAYGTWLLIDLAVAEAKHRFVDQGRLEEISPAITLGKRLARAVLIMVAVSILLSHFGINMTALAALLGLGGLAFSLAARDTIADAIAGIIILLDRPFRVGDRIEISAANTWGDVTDIGLRTTRILTRDNRLVIIPNSLISKNEIINYTYPDPNYRIETHVGIAFDTDIESARKIMREAVRQVPEVLPNKPVDILYSDMGDSAMVFRVRWWIETYADTRRITDQVHTSLQHFLDEAGIEMPFPTQSIYMHDFDPE